jgi:hypothetical protein
MEASRASLTALGRAHVAFFEQLAWFALESLERAHRLNMDAVEAFCERPRRRRPRSDRTPYPIWRTRVRPGASPTPRERERSRFHLMDELLRQRKNVDECSRENRPS